MAPHAASSKDLSLELEYGQCRFGLAKDGTYHDRRFGSHNYLTPRCASIGLAGKFQRFATWGWRVAFIQSGSVEARDNMAQMNDGNPSPHPCNETFGTFVHWENCHGLFGGSGRMRGIKLAVTKEWNLGARWWTQAEAGVEFFEHFFNGYVKPYDFDGAFAPAVGATGGSATKWEGGGLNQESALADKPLPLLGARIGYGPLYFVIRYQFPVNRPGQSITDHSHLDLMGGLRIPL